MAQLLMAQTAHQQPWNRQALHECVVHAAAQGKPVRLSASIGGRKQSWRGVLTAQDSGGLQVRVALDLPLELMASRWEGALETEEGRIVFETGCAKIVREGSDAVLHLRWPPATLTGERRRSPRRSLREPTEVQLREIKPASCPSEDSPAQESLGGSFVHANGERSDHHATFGREDEFSHTATLLNLSAQGLACRLRETEVVDWNVEKCFQVRFHLHETEKAFTLTARLVSLTPAGTPNSIVAGMEFVADPQSQPDLDRLRTLLPLGHPRK